LNGKQKNKKNKLKEENKNTNKKARLDPANFKTISDIQNENLEQQKGSIDKSDIEINSVSNFASGQKTTLDELKKNYKLGLSK